MPVRDPEELVLVGGSQYPVFQAFRQHTDIFDDLLAASGITPLDVEIRGGARERTNVSLVSGSYFSTLGVQPAMGRLFTIDDDRVPGAHPIAVASSGYWRRRFGSDATAPGQVVHISGTPISTDGSRVPLAVATDARLLGFVLLISCGTAILFGLAPAWRLARADIVASLVARRGASGRPHRLSSIAVVAQVALSLVLLMGAGLWARLQ